MKTFWLLMLGCATVAAHAGTRDTVQFVPATRVTAAFAKGEPLLETPDYKVHASRREGPGQAEVHTTDTDIVYILDGTATLVTGGTVIDGRTVAPREVRGASIAGGDSRRLVKGDVIVIPHGMPHQFQEVSAPFLYYVVKVADVTGGTR
jgi:glc operon protein GlcG